MEIDIVDLFVRQCEQGLEADWRRNSAFGLVGQYECLADLSRSGGYQARDDVAIYEMSRATGQAKPR